MTQMNERLFYRFSESALTSLYLFYKKEADNETFKSQYEILDQFNAAGLTLLSQPVRFISKIKTDENKKLIRFLFSRFYVYLRSDKDSPENILPVL